MADIKIDGGLFNKRIQQIQKAISTKDGLVQGAESIFVLIGKVDDENPYRKSSVLHVCFIFF